MEPHIEKQGHGRREVAIHSPVFRLAFNLRTLLLIVTVLCAFLGCHVNWIGQRRAFLSEQVARLESSIEHGDGVWPEQLVGWWIAQQPPAWRDPGPLRLFLVPPPVYGMFVLIPAEDIIDRGNRFEVLSSQSDLQRARRLFPEEDIEPIYWKSSERPKSEDHGFRQVKIVE